MTTGESIVAGMTAAKAAFEVGKEAIDLLKHPKIDGEAVQGKILQLQEHVLSVQSALAEAREENFKLTRALDERSRLLDFGKQFSSKDGVYWRENFPYCPNCWNVDSKPIRLDGPYRSASPAKSMWTCPIHDSKYYLANRSTDS